VLDYLVCEIVEFFGDAARDSESQDPHPSSSDPVIKVDQGLNLAAGKGEDGEKVLTVTDKKTRNNTRFLKPAAGNHDELDRLIDKKSHRLPIGGDAAYRESPPTRED
jgi:hypothetical protein